jgi:peptide/nickel transport system substrate-binding protein
MSVIWKLKKDVQWHDGKPFTADDVVFNWEYAADPATAATTISASQDAKVENTCSSPTKGPIRAMLRQI